MLLTIHAPHLKAGEFQPRKRGLILREKPAVQQVWGGRLRVGVAHEM